MNFSEENFVVVGQLGSPHGIDGRMRMHSYTEPVENVLSYQPWFVQKKGASLWEKIHCKKVEHHAKGFVVFLDGITDRNAAMIYTLATIAVSRDHLPDLPEDEYYWSDLEGLDVKTPEGVLLGKVDHLFETGSNDVLVVKGEKEHLIPYLKGDTIIHIDIPNTTILVNWDPDF